jgi:glycosyltransferase involved in cell wall biosynthesis
MVRLVRGVNANDLTELFKSSSVFVMPSLVEGFGQVYLEALAHGCPVLGTANTGLPDVRADNDPIWHVEPGQVDQIVSMLESLARSIPGDLSIRRRAQECARRWPWQRFRKSICDHLNVLAKDTF